MLARYVSNSFDGVGHSAPQPAEFTRGPPSPIPPLLNEASLSKRFGLKEMSRMKMDRGEFLRKAGLGSIALAAAPKIVDTLVTPVWAQGRINFHFDCVSVAGSAGTPAAPQHTLIFAGQGSFDPSRVGSKADGGGFYVHYLFPGANPPPRGTPLPVVASGKWGNGRLVSYTPLGTFGVQGAGILVMVIDLFGEIPSKAMTRGATLKVACAIGAAGIPFPPGEREGIVLSIPGTEFAAGGTPGPFAPVGPFPPALVPGVGAPGVGVTGFSIGPIP